MKRTTNIVAILIVVLTSAAASASGQMAQRYRAEIPFDFSIGKSDMKAGNYAIALLNNSSSISVLGLVNRDSGETNIIKPVLLGDLHPDREAVLRFARSGSHYELIAVKTAEFETTLRRTWVDVRQVTKASAGSDETVSIRLR